MPDDAARLAALIARLRAARPAPGRDCREDIEAAIAAVDQAMGEAGNA